MSLEVYDLLAVARDLCTLAAILGAMGALGRADELVAQASDLLVHRAQLLRPRLTVCEAIDTPPRRRSDYWGLPWMN